MPVTVRCFNHNYVLNVSNSSFGASLAVLARTHFRILYFDDDAMI